MPNACLLTGRVAQALTKIQRDLRVFGLSLKVLDCYRPQAAVNYFVRWAGNSSDASMRAQYHPRVGKTDLIAKGYIASPSSHSRGSTVDVTVVSMLPSENPGAEKPASCGGSLGNGALDMGTGYDCFDKAAHTYQPVV